MRVRSPRSIPTYKLRFQPQPSARGSEVDATRNLLGAGMKLGRNQLLPLQLKMLLSLDLLRGYTDVALQEPFLKQVSCWFG